MFANRAKQMVLPDSEQVSQGVEELLEILREEPLWSAPCELARPNAHRSVARPETDMKVIVKHTFIEVVVESECKGRSRAMSDSVLFHSPSKNELSWQPLPTLADLSDASTTVSEDQEEAQPDVSSGGETGADGIQNDTCWPYYEGMDIYSQQQWMPMESWWMPMNFNENTAMVCAPMPDGQQWADQKWADQGDIECNGVVAEAADEEWRTTVMLRNMPNNYTRDMLLDFVDTMGFAGRYDFAYLPVDFKSQVGLGYAFINFASIGEAQLSFDRFEGFSDWKVPSEKVCTVTWGSPYQGLDAHIERYQNSPVMHQSIPDDWKPVLFNQQGLRIPFPAPTRPMKSPKVRQQPAASS